MKKKTVVKIVLKCTACSAVICGAMGLKRFYSENKRLRESRDAYKQISEEQQRLLERYKKYVGPVDG